MYDVKTYLKMYQGFEDVERKIPQDVYDLLSEKMTIYDNLSKECTCNSDTLDVSFKQLDKLIKQTISKYSPSQKCSFNPYGI